MSEVTNVILHIFSDEESDIIAEMLNVYIREKQGKYYPAFVSFDFEITPKNPFPKNVWYGGSKYLEADLYCGAINHLDLNDLITYIKSQKWPDFTVIQLMVMEQDDAKFKIIDVVSQGV